MANLALISFVVHAKEEILAPPLSLDGLPEWTLGLDSPPIINFYYWGLRTVGDLYLATVRNAGHLGPPYIGLVRTTLLEARDVTPYYNKPEVYANHSAV